MLTCAGNADFWFETFLFFFFFFFRFLCLSVSIYFARCPRSLSHSLPAAPIFVFGILCAVKHTLHTHADLKGKFIWSAVKGEIRLCICIHVCCTYGNSDGGRGSMYQSVEMAANNSMMLTFVAINIVNFIRTTNLCWQKSWTNKEMLNKIRNTSRVKLKTYLFMNQ